MRSTARFRRSGARPVLAAACAAASAPFLLAIAQVPGPIEVGPSWATADDAGHSGMMFARIANHGALADRLMSVGCPAFGQVTLAGLDPATQGDRGAEQGVLLEPAAVVTMSANGPHIEGHDARGRLPPGMLISCVLHFAHAGERITVFSVGPEGRVTDEP